MAYDIHDIGNDALIASQTKAADRGDASAHVTPSPNEPAQVQFDGKVTGELFNSLSLDVTATVTLWSYIIDPLVSVAFPTTIDLADDGQWKVTFQEERITHVKQ